MEMANAVSMKRLEACAVIIKRDAWLTAEIAVT